MTADTTSVVFVTAILLMDAPDTFDHRQRIKSLVQKEIGKEAAPTPLAHDNSGPIRKLEKNNDPVGRKPEFHFSDLPAGTGQLQHAGEIPEKSGVRSQASEEYEVGMSAVLRDGSVRTPTEDQGHAKGLEVRSKKRGARSKEQGARRSASYEGRVMRYCAVED